MIPTSTNLSIKVSSTLPKTGAAAVFLAKDASASDHDVRRLPEPVRKAVASLIKSGMVTGKSREVSMHLCDDGRRKLLVIGIGPRARIGPDCLRQAAGTLAKALARYECTSVSVIAPSVLSPSEVAEALTTGLALGSFKYLEQKGTTLKKRKPISVTLIADRTVERVMREASARAKVVADGQNFARTIAARPGNVINPPALAKVAQDLAMHVGLTCKVLDETQMKKLGMGGILAVGAGSESTPPRMIVLEWKGKSKSPSPLLVIGKAITFDTGGISIKPAEKMGAMVYDKCGAMAVLGLMYSVAMLKLPVRVVGILSSAENHISGTAYRPGDIIRLYNGTTVEITNTDAEGRLVLGDALAWGIETYKPAAVVDLATLTGGCVVALGSIYAGLMSNNSELVDQIQSSAARAGEKTWRLPIGDDVREMLRSEHADIINSAGRQAAPLTGGAFLSFFVPPDGKVPWAHIDIAGVATTDKELPCYAKGATGWGVRTLVNWIESRTER